MPGNTSHRAPRPSPSCLANGTELGAFTLVELLVVIGIIALLISILIPSLSAARRQSQLTQCMSMQRQMFVGATIHAGARQGYYPLAGHFIGLPTGGGTRAVQPADIGDPLKRRYTYVSVDESWFKGITLAPWHVAIAQYMGKKHVLDSTNNDQIILDEIGYRNYLKYFTCPSHAQEPAEIPGALVYYGGGLLWYLQQSYVLNEAVFGMNDRLGRLRGKASRIRRPSETMLLADGNQSLKRSIANGKMNWATFINKTAVGPVTLADALANNSKAGDNRNFDVMRHKGKIDILFADGHSETRRIDAKDLASVYLLAN